MLKDENSKNQSKHFFVTIKQILKTCFLGSALFQRLFIDSTLFFWQHIAINQVPLASSPLRSRKLTLFFHKTLLLSEEVVMDDHVGQAQ